MKNLYFQKASKTIGNLVSVKSIFFILCLLFFQHLHAQIAELSDYKWEVFNNVKSTIELPNNIENFDWEPKNDPGFGNEGLRPNNKKQYSFVLNNPKSKFFQLILNESTPKGIRTHIITLIVSDKEFDPTANSSNRRFKTDKDIIDAMALQQKLEQTVAAKPAPESAKPITESAKPNTKPIENKPVAVEKQPNETEDKINAADKLFKQQDLKGAETLYKEALVQDPSNPHIKAQLENIRSINAKFAAEIESLEIRQKTYQQNLNKAEDYANRSEWAMARFYYNEALKYAANTKPINDALKIVERKENEYKQIENNYNNYKLKAQNASQNKDYAMAINSWEEALKIKPEDTYAKAELAKSKINLQEKLAEELRIQKFYEERKIENEFLAQMARADIALKNNDFETSRKEVAKAAEIKSADLRIGQKMAFIDQTELKYKEAQTALLIKSQEQQYNALITDAQKQNAAGKYLEAINLYEEAQRAKPSDPYPGLQIKSIIAKQESLAKEAELRKKEAALAAIKMQIDKQITAGDKALAANNLDEAISAFLEANRLDPGNTYPAERLKIIEEKKAALEAKMIADRQKEEEQRLLKFKYDSVMAIADALIMAEQFDNAILAYEDALKIKPNDYIASGKIATSKKLKQEAIEAELLAIKLAKDKALDSLETLGTNAIVAGNYYEARDYFSKASEIFPEPSGYTKSQLRHITLTIADKEKKEKEQKNDFNYALFVKTADSAIVAGNLPLALVAAQNALKIREEDSRAKSLVFRLTDPDERKRLEMNANRILSNNLVDTAQIQYQGKNYVAALALLDRAFELWPQNNRIAFLKNQAVEGLTGVPTNQKNQAEVKFTFEKNQAFRRTGTSPSGDNKARNSNDVSIGVNNDVKKTSNESTKTNTAEYKPKTDTIPAIQARLKPEDTEFVAENTMKNKADEAKGTLLIQNEPARSDSSVTNVSSLYNDLSANTVIKTQRIEIPYPPNILSEKFPDIDFSKPPHGQKFTIDFYNENEKEMNRSKSVEVMEAPSNLPVRDSSNNILVHLDNLSFGVYNSYYRISISNFSDKDFSVGYMMLSVERKNGESTNYEPSYITAFPVIMPMHRSQFVYVTRQIQLNTDDKIILNLFERRTNTRFTIELPGELYNNEFDK